MQFNRPKTGYSFIKK